MEAAIDDINLYSIGLNGELGDVNFDDAIDILDVVLVVNFVLETTAPDAMEAQAADVNSDNQLDVLDVVLIVNLILD